MILAIVGPTASGKSDLALQLAQEIGGEIICADSRTFYRGLDIATAKPTMADRALVPHHMIDIRDVGDVMTAQEFQREVQKLLPMVAARGHVSIIVGGSGLYVDSVLYKYQFPGSVEGLRQELSGMSLDMLVDRLKMLGPEATQGIDLANPRRVIRAIETAGMSRSKLKSARSDSVVVGLALSKSVAEVRIRSRVQHMVEQGLMDEVQAIGETYGWESVAFDIIGYRAMKPVALGEISIEEGTEKFVSADMQLFRKQMTWFKRNKDIRWLDAGEPNVIAKVKSIARQFEAESKPFIA